MADMTVPAPAGAVTCFSVAAYPDPGLMPRVLELFAKRGLVPSRFIAQVDDAPEPRMELDIQASGLTLDVAAHMARSMGQIAGVERVLMAERSLGAN